MKLRLPRRGCRGAVLRSLGAAAAVALLAACGERDASPDAHAAPIANPTPLQVAVKRAERARVPIVLEAVGQAEGSREVEVRPRVSGILEKRLYAEGSPVKAGQTLFLIDRAPFEIAAAQARAALSQERARHELAQSEAARLKPLVDTKAISRREYDQAASSVKESAAATEGAQAKLAEAQLNLSYTSLKAPINGITSRAVRSEGSLVAANTDLLTTITQVDPIWVRFSIAQADFARVRGSGASAQVSLVKDDGSIGASGGRLNFTASTVDPKVGTVQLRAEFPNAHLEWLPGQFVKVRIQIGMQDAFLIPQAAVLQTEQARKVWIATPDGKAVQRDVRTANWLGSDWIVTGGLEPGDLVIVDGLMKLRPGVAVEARAPDASARQATATPAGTSPAHDPRASGAKQD
jgi:membrane fusion protein (multidrug efflux system)